MKDRLLQRINKTTSGCWLWIGSVDKDGYGCIGRHGRVHRIAYIEFVGAIPAKHDVDHLCWQRACCNPEHLRVLPLGENRRRTRQALSDTCKRGHMLTGENLYLYEKDGKKHRFCRLCNKLAVRKYAAKKAVRRGYVEVHKGEVPGVALSGESAAGALDAEASGQAAGGAAV